MAQPRGGGRGEAQPLPAHDARPAAPTVSNPPACSLGVETEIYFNDSLKPNCIQAAIQREEPPTCGSTTVRRALKASPKTQGRQTVSFWWGQTAGPGAGSGAAWHRGRDPKKQPRKVSVLFICLCPPDATASTSCLFLNSREEARPALELGCPSPEPQTGSYFRRWPSPSLKDMCAFNSPVFLRTL